MLTARSAPQVHARLTAECREIITPAALEFLSRLHREFEPRRRTLAFWRSERQAALDAGWLPTFLPATVQVRNGDWTIAPVPDDLQDRRVEITGPTDAKMMINALNSGANVFMADFEDANSPTWLNMVQGQYNVRAAVCGTIHHETPEGKRYRLNEQTATLMIRPRGWHLEERHVLIDGEPISASLFDFGLFVFHNARTLVEKGSGAYLYLPKLESHLEARLWNDVFGMAEESLGLAHGTVRCTVLIETILAAFEMDEILHELRDHIVGLNAGRWDYIFSIIKKFRHAPKALLPDRSQITMTVPFMRAYTELLVRTCHRREAHAIGGMAAYIPSRHNPQVNEQALSKVREDKLRESLDGFDGTWVAHPDLVPVAKEVFDRTLGEAPHQKEKMREDVHVSAKDLVDFEIPRSAITEAGLRANISIAIRYLESWLRGVGAAAIDNLMEDTATAEICRAQLWQWVHHEAARLNDGRPITPDLYRDVMSQECARLQNLPEMRNKPQRGLEAAAQLLNRLTMDADFPEFLTLAASGRLEELAEELCA